MTSNSWNVLPLDQLVDQVSRLVKVSDTRVYKLMGVRWYGLGCHIHTVASGSELKTASLNQVKIGDVTYNKMWVTKGALGVIESDEELFATTEYPTFEARADRTDTRFLKYVFQSPHFLSVASDVCRGSTSRARLNPRDFLNLKVLAPPLPEQRKIAAILTAVDDAIAATEAVIEQLQVVKKAMMSELLTRGIPGRHTKFKQTEIGEIPEEWEVVRLDSLVTVDTGFAFPSKDFSDEPSAVPVVRMSDLKKGKVDLRHAARVSPNVVAGLSRFQLKPGDFLVGLSGSIGNFGIYDDAGETAYLNQRVGRLSLPTICAEYVHAWYLSAPVQAQLVQLAAGGAQPNLSPTAIRSLLVPKPSRNEAEQIGLVFGSVTARIDAESSKLHCIEKTKLALMSVLLTGEVRVRPAEDGE